MERPLCPSITLNPLTLLYFLQHRSTFASLKIIYLLVYRLSPLTRMSALQARDLLSLFMGVSPDSTQCLTHN